MTGTPGTSGPETISGRGESAQFVDLQVHSTASDGALSPTKVVEAARDAQLYAIALTDHDTVDGLPEAIAAGVACGVRIIAGVELSSHFDDDELHLLGLHLSNQDAMRSALRVLQVGRVERAVRIVEVLNKHSIPVTMESVLAEANKGAVGRPHVARAMVAGGWVRDFREAFDRWIGFGRPAYMAKERFDVADAIALVHKAGGLAVWAHPGDSATGRHGARVRRGAAPQSSALALAAPVRQHRESGAVTEWWFRLARHARWAAPSWRTARAEDLA